SFLADDNGGAVGTHLEEYSYLGLGTVVKRTHPQGVYTIGLTYLKQPGDLPLDASIDPGDQYTGLDRFGRVRDQRWLKTNAVITTLDDFVYGYDPDGNRLYRDNLVNANFGELYHANGAANGYDGLNQLVAFSRGALNATKDTIANAPHSQSWVLDALGNWSSVT